MLPILLLVVAALAIILLPTLRGWWWGAKLESHFAVAQSFLGIAALVSGTAWYVVARPDSAKLKFDQSATVVPLADHRVLLLTELSLTNLGTQTLTIKTPLKLIVQQVTPLVPEAEAEYQPTHTNSAPRLIGTADTWASVARLDSEINSEIEADEVENMYYRVILPCQDNLRVYVSTWVVKPQTDFDKLLKKPRLAWIKQSFVDISESCRNRPRKPKK